MIGLFLAGAAAAYGVFVAMDARSKAEEVRKELNGSGETEDQDQDGEEG